jgi:hypothetical protein
MILHIVHHPSGIRWSWTIEKRLKTEELDPFFDL